jgi:cytoskeletal protein CcmA (bactofilin family)
LRDQPELDTMLFKRRIQDSSAGPTTYIAASTKIVGTITGQGPYVFCGTVEGDCDINGPLTLAPGAIWRGTLKASDLVVAGTVEGDVVARQRVEISGTARVTGSLSGNSIAVAEGAVIEGDIKVTNGEQPATFQEKRVPEEA